MSAPMRPHGNAAVSAAERAYGLLLHAYPAGFRAAYGREMALAFRDQRRASARNGALDFWAATVWDVARSAPALRLDALRAQVRARQDARWSEHTDIQLGGTTMHAVTKTTTTNAIGLLAILVGVYEAGNALAEAWAGVSAGGTANGGAPWVATVALAVVAGAVLVAAGAALLRRGAGAAAWARGAAAACLAMCVIAGFVHPWMAVLARLLGIVFPLAVLLILRRGRGPSVPAVA